MISALMTSPRGVRWRRRRLLERYSAWSGALPEALVLLLGRVLVARVFWEGGRSKMDGWFSLRPVVVDLFRDEYRLPLIPPGIAAPLTAGLEHVLAVLLVAGLCSRLAASGFIAMTAVIQLFVYPEEWWTQHGFWVALLLFVVVRGPGPISVDGLLRRRAPWRARPDRAGDRVPSRPLPPVAAADRASLTPRPAPIRDDER